MTHVIKQQAVVPIESSGKRLDQVAAELFPDFSRAKLQEWMKEGSLLWNGEQGKPKNKVRVGDKLSIEAEQQELLTDIPQDLELDVVYEDEQLLLVNKPAGLVVHPAAGDRKSVV